MDEFFVETELDREQLLRDVRQHPLPFSVAIRKNVTRRSAKQNRLQFMWFNEVAKIVSSDTGDTPEEIRGYCKLVLGVPILRAENEKFRERYDRVVRPLPYARKIALMTEFDFPVTRLMNKGQMSKYLDGVFKHFSGQGIELPQPPDITEACAPKKRRAA